MLVRAPAPVLALRERYGIKVFARNGTLGGLISSKYLGAPPPDTVKGAWAAGAMWVAVTGPMCDVVGGGRN